MDLYIKPMEIYGKWLGVVGKWLGCIQPMCSAPGAFPPGAFFRQKSAPFPKKCLFGCFYDKTFLFIIKRPGWTGFGRPSENIASESQKTIADQARR